MDSYGFGGWVRSATQRFRYAWVLLKIRVPFRVLLIRVPYYFGDSKEDPNLENYPHEVSNMLYLLVAEFISIKQSAHFQCYIRNPIIPKSLKCCHPATKFRLRLDY